MGNLYKESVSLKTMKSFYGEAKNATQLSLELEEKRVKIEKLDL